MEALVSLASNMMPDAAQILGKLEGIAHEGAAFSPFVRLMLVALIVLCFVRKKLLADWFAGYVGLTLLSASIMGMGFEGKQILFIFFTLAPVGLMWGREALIMPPRPRAGVARIAVASVIALAGFFYPHFVNGPVGALLFAPVGILPCPTLIIACAAIILTGRSYSLYAVVPTWVLGAFYGSVGIFHLRVAVDWALLAAVAASIVSYILSYSGDDRPKGKRFRRKH